LPYILMKIWISLIQNQKRGWLTRSKLLCFACPKQSNQTKGHPNNLPHVKPTWGSRAVSLCKRAGLTRCPARKPESGVLPDSRYQRDVDRQTVGGNWKTRVLRNKTSDAMRFAYWALRAVRGNKTLVSQKRTSEDIFVIGQK
jgi:hypothetical protein